MTKEAFDRLVGTWSGIAVASSQKCATPDGQTLLCCCDEPTETATFLTFEINDAGKPVVQYSYTGVTRSIQRSGNIVYFPAFSWTMEIQDVDEVRPGAYMVAARSAMDSTYCLHVLLPEGDGGEMSVGVRVRQTYTPSMEVGQQPAWDSDYWCSSFVEPSVGGCEPGSSWPQDRSITATSGWHDSQLLLQRSDSDSVAADSTADSTISSDVLVGLVLGVVAAFACLGALLLMICVRSRRHTARAVVSVPVESVLAASAASSTSAAMDGGYNSSHTEEKPPIEESRANDFPAEGTQENDLSQDNGYSSGIWGHEVQIVAQGLAEHWLINMQDLAISDCIAGRGGFGDVRPGMLYDSTKVALKTGRAAKDRAREVWQSLANEIRLLRRLRHPNIVLFFGVCVLPGAQFGLVLEWVEGLNLRDYTKRCRGWLHLVDPQEENPDDSQSKLLGPNHKAKLLLDVTAGMQYLHAQRPQVIHRDLKPANILVETVATPPRAKITDFGVSMLLKGDSGTGRAGTKNFMAPEVLEARNYNVSADVYSFACTSCYVFAGCVPQKDRIEEAERALMDATAPEEVARLVASGMEKEPDARPSFALLRSALSDWACIAVTNDSTTSSTWAANAHSRGIKDAGKFGTKTIMSI